MENHIKEILAIEKQAQAIHNEAITKSEKLQKVAEQDAQRILEKARSEAKKEARYLIEQASNQDDVEEILDQVGEKIDSMKSLALNHFDRAVGYVLDQIAGRE